MQSYNNYNSLHCYELKKMNEELMDTGYRMHDAWYRKLHYVKTDAFTASAIRYLELCILSCIKFYRMPGNDATVEAHYTREGLFEAILSALNKAGVDIHAVTRKDIAGVDEFHVRGYEVSRQLAQEAGLKKDSRLLDLGCGLGGPCRMLADEFGCIVTGVDITAEYIRTAALLSELTGLQQHTRFIIADVLDLPFEDASFDAAWTQHVQMNVDNKQRMYNEAARVLVKGGLFVYYDIFSIDHKEVYYPTPWASKPALSHLITRDEHQLLLQKAGLTVQHSIDQTAKGILFFEKLFERAEQKGVPVVSLQLLMGDDYRERVGNLYRNLREGRVMLESGIGVRE